MLMHQLKGNTFHVSPALSFPASQDAASLTIHFSVPDNYPPPETVTGDRLLLCDWPLIDPRLPCLYVLESHIFPVLYTTKTQTQGSEGLGERTILYLGNEVKKRSVSYFLKI